LSCQNDKERLLIAAANVTGIFYTASIFENIFLKKTAFHSNALKFNSHIFHPNVKEMKTENTNPDCIPQWG
jgi:hypothetical protein